MELLIKLKKNNQTISLWYDEDLEELVYKSPLSGYYIYRYCDNTGFFVNKKDDHFLDELLVKEQQKLMTGYLDL